MPAASVALAGGWCLARTALPGLRALPVCFALAKSERRGQGCLLRDNLCTLLETHPDCVNLKAKTHEKVDSIGEERSIACHTVVLLLRTE